MQILVAKSDTNYGGNGQSGITVEKSKLSGSR